MAGNDVILYGVPAGNDVVLRDPTTTGGTNYTLTAQGGAYSLTGAPATITKATSGVNYTLTANGGLYALTGGAAGLIIGRRIAASGGVYALTGGQATIAKTSGAASYVLTALGGAYLVSGGSASLNVTTTAPLGGGVRLRKTYQYKYQAELDKLAPEVASAISAKAVEVVSQEASQAQARETLARMGIAYQQAYQEIFAELVAEMRQAQEDEQIALLVASIL